MSTSGWNRPKSPAKKKQQHASLRGLGAGLIVAILGCCVVAYFFAFEQHEFGAGNNKHGTPLIDEHATSASALKDRIPCVSPDLSAANQNTDSSRGANDIASKVTEFVSTTNSTKKAKVVFKNPMDQLMAMVVPQEVGQAVPPVPIFSDEDFSPEQENEMFEQMLAEDDDSEETLERKELIQSLREEFTYLKTNHGWKFSDYIKAMYAKAELDNAILRESCEIHESVFHDPNISDEKYLETLDKINSVLTQRGIKPISATDDDEFDE